MENSNTTFTDFALTELTTGLHCLHCKDDWETVELSDNATVILGTPAETLRDDPTYWITRVHPSDADAVRGALHTTTEKIEKHISFRYRDSSERYRWIGLRCKLANAGIIVGTFSDITRARVLEYGDRIHFAGRNSLRALLDSNDLTVAINQFLDLLGNAMHVDRARLIRFRTDDKAFITHEWLRSEEEAAIDSPIELSSAAVKWWLTELKKLGVVSIQNTASPEHSDEMRQAIQSCSVGAIMAVPAVINGVMEGLICFETKNERMWLPLELEEATHIVEGYSRSVERRIEDREQIAQEFHLRRSEERYRMLTAHSPVILFGIDSDGVFTLSEGLGLESMGAGAGEVVGKSVYQVYRNYPDVLEQVNAALSGEQSHGLTHIGDKCFEVWFTPVSDDDGAMVGLSGVAIDITRRSKLEQQQSIMMSELDHRVKNNIAAVMSLVGLSKPGAKSIDDFAKTLDGRLHALAVAHSTLAKSHWSGAWMRDVLQLTLQPYMSGTVERMRFEGPDVELPGMLARPMCMIIHELATNAVKYGSLSNANGTVLITMSHDTAKNSLRISWQEFDGPAVSSVITPGTGTSLLEGLVDHEMDGVISLEYKVDGLVCQITVPLEDKT
ncbi:MAG: PAS domain-containing protein [Phycisphaerae bacterium]|nr:PAS domain-containing protein [Phycisphaerae bacterium]